MTYSHVAVSTADTSQQDNFMDSHTILKSCLQNCRAMAEEPQAFQSNSSAEDPLLWETSVP